MVLRDVSTIDVNYVKKLYREAFPLRERIPFSKLLKLQKNGIIRILAAYENGEPCGLAVTCTGSKSVLLMYLAVDGNKRGQGLGSKIMPALCDTFPRRNLLLEIEKPDEQAHDRAPKGILSSLRSARCGCRYIIGRSSNGNSYDRRRRVRQIRIYRHLS